MLTFTEKKKEKNTKQMSHREETFEEHFLFYIYSLFITYQKNWCWWGVCGSHESLLQFPLLLGGCCAVM
jgi:hypothetical protein